MIKENIDLKKYTTFKVGGNTKYFAKIKRSDDIPILINWAKEKNIPFFVLGGGSNVIFPDNGFNGLIIKMDNEDIEKQDVLKFRFGAGLYLFRLIDYLLKNNIAGMEWSAGIPGSLGGAIRGNAKAFGSSMSDFVEKVFFYDSFSGEFKELKKDDCCFGEKTSIFKKDKSLIITSAVLKLKKGDKKEIKDKIKSNLDYRKKNHPGNFSAGCMFVNPIGGPSAGELIEEVGLKGFRMGGAEISSQHANFIINKNRASFEDVNFLVKTIKSKVKKEKGILLEEEPDIVV